MAWRKKPGLSQVRPAINAIFGPAVAFEKSDPKSTEAWNWTPFAFHLAAISAKAFPGGRSLPAPRKAARIDVRQPRVRDLAVQQLQGVVPAHAAALDAAADDGVVRLAARQR